MEGGITEAFDDLLFLIMAKCGRGKFCPGKQISFSGHRFATTNVCHKIWQTTPKTQNIKTSINRRRGETAAHDTFRDSRDHRPQEMLVISDVRGIIREAGPLLSGDAGSRERYTIWCRGVGPEYAVHHVVPGALPEGASQAEVRPALSARNPTPPHLFRGV